MTDPKPKLPLRLEHDRDYEDLWFIEDADENAVPITQHRAKLIVAALTADAERKPSAASKVLHDSRNSKSAMTGRGQSLMHRPKKGRHG